MRRRSRQVRYRLSRGTDPKVLYKIVKVIQMLFLNTAQKLTV